ncbi:hypothetical protein WJX75_005138 [Coccomyxa subellipsoidea]|uniref:CID domain-containing protein n=1 Tax=Coccomyxa subellipsoidea TaxID=248742 RepID=A0ABR2Z091_9CHLO
MDQYVSELADLTFNSKPIINTLTMLASENVKAASSIAAAVEKHIYNCSAAYKLYGLYLMDSIIKNVRQPYTSLFSRNLPEVYMNVWSAAPQSRPALQKLFNFWKGFLPDQTLAAITERQAAQQIRGWPPLHNPLHKWLKPPYRPCLRRNRAVRATSCLHPFPRLPPRRHVRRAQAHMRHMYSSSIQQPPTSSVSEDDYWADLEPEELPLKTVDRRKMDFDSDRLKAQSPSVVKELMACTAALRPRHLDRMFLHRRRTRGAGRRVLSQQWYVCADDWIAGTAADVQAAPAFFDLPVKDAVKKEAMSVPVDDAQPNCALSGERFETFWDDASEEWRYRDAMRLDAEQAARYGLHEGVIVKVTALSAGPDPFLEQECAAEEPAEEPSAEAAPAQETTQPAAASGAVEEPAPSTEVEPSTTVKIEAEAAAAEEAAMEAADQVEGADQQAAAASVPAAVEASPQPPGLETLSQLNGQANEDLSEREQQSLQSYPLSLRILAQDSGPNAVFEIYKRINSGGENLNDQQARKAAFWSPYMRLLNELADDPILMKERGASERDDEQETDRELILRFFAMHGHMGEYRMPLSNFLNDEADRGISLSTEQLQQRRELFERAISNVYAIWGNDSFQKHDSSSKLEPSLWDTLMCTFSRYKPEQLKGKGEALREDLRKVVITA